MKIGFITDTNIIKQNASELHSDTPFLNHTEFFLDYIDSLNNTKYKDTLYYIMPTIIMDELLNQKLLEFNKSYDLFVKKYNNISFGMSGNLPKNVYLNKLKNERKQQVSRFLTIEPKLNSKTFNETLNDALTKKAPFDKTIDGQKTDAGFKDYMIWKTIEHANLNDFDEIYFFSGDKVFDENKELLEKEFQQLNKNTKIHIIKIPSEEIDKVKICLETIIKNHSLPKTELIELYDYNLLLKNILDIEFAAETDEIYYFLDDNRKLILNNIKFDKFDTSDFIVTNINKNDDNYEVILEFNTTKYTSNLDNEEINKKSIIGNINLTFNRNNKQFHLIKKSISNVTFNCVINNLSDLTIFYNNLWQNTFANSIKKIVDAISSITVQEFIDNVNCANILNQYADIINQTKIQVAEAINKTLPTNVLNNIDDKIKDEKQDKN